jgi:hypothetical protein
MNAMEQFPNNPVPNPPKRPIEIIEREGSNDEDVPEGHVEVQGEHPESLGNPAYDDRALEEKWQREHPGLYQQSH